MSLSSKEATTLFPPIFPKATAAACRTTPCLSFFNAVMRCFLAISPLISPNAQAALLRTVARSSFSNASTRELTASVSVPNFLSAIAISLRTNPGIGFNSPQLS